MEFRQWYNYRRNAESNAIPPLYLTKAFDLVSREGLFNILLKSGCPPKLHSLIRSFHDDMKASILHKGSMSDSFDIKSKASKAVSLLPPSSASSLPCSYSMLLVLQLKGCTYAPGPMVNCSTLLD